MSKITNIFFSPSETTKKVLNQMASNFSKDYEICDLLLFLQEEFQKPQEQDYPS